MHEGDTKAVAAAFAANLGIAVAKLIGFALTSATSMLAEAVHSLADCGNQALLTLGGARARRAPTSEHPFGHGRERYFWAFVVAMMLFAVGGGFAIFEGIDKLRHPHPLQSPLIAIAILAFSIAAEGWSLRVALREARANRVESSWWEFIRKTKAAELPVILLEDIAALIGLVLALAGVGLSMLTGDPRLDGAGSIAIGVLLTLVAAVLATEMRSLLMGEAASEADVSKIRAALLQSPRLRRIIHLRTMHLSPEELLVAVKAEFAAELSFAELAAEIDRVEQNVRASVNRTCVIYIEPDVWHDPEP
ncbi:MAG: cation diffusion facilitator family transporter [Polyangiales bacterium]